MTPNRKFFAKRPRNPRCLALTIISALMVACQQNPQQATVQYVAPSPIAESQENPKASNTEALLAQLLPPNSCPNTLNNLKFAAEQGLFLRENFYSEANAKRFFGDYYRINGVTIKPNFQQLTLSSAYFVNEHEWSLNTFKNHEYPWFPCFSTITIERRQPLKGKRNYQVESSFSANYAEIKPSFNLYVEQFVALFGKPDRVIFDEIEPLFHACGEGAFHGNPPNRECHEAKRKKQEGRTAHVYGEKLLGYFLKTPSHNQAITLKVSFDGIVEQFIIHTEEK